MNLCSIKKFTLIILFVLSGCVANIPSESINETAQKYIDRGVAFMEHAKWDLAEASFRVAAEYQQVPQAYDGLGCVALAQNDFETARYLFDRILKWFPDYTPVFWHLAYLEEAKGNLNTAEYWHKKAVDENPLGAKEKTNYAYYLKDKYLNNPADRFSRDLARSYFEDVIAIEGN